MCIEIDIFSLQGSGRFYFSDLFHFPAEYDPNKHCGVWISETKKHCTHSLTCKVLDICTTVTRNHASSSYSTYSVM